MIIEWLLAATLLASLLALLFAALAWRAAAREKPLRQEDVATVLRGECDGVRRAGEDQMRGLRQDVGGVLAQNLNTTMTALTAMSGDIRGQVDGFGERLAASNRVTEERVAGIGLKLNDDIAALASAAAMQSETLRASVATKLDGALTKQSETARDMREDLNASFRRLGGDVAATLTAASETQKERLDNTQRALTLLTEQHGQAGESLRQTVQERLDKLRQENASELEKVRQTVDEKLQTTLEKRLGESFNRVVEQLVRVSQDIGEMKTLATNVGDLKNVLTNVKVRGTFGEVQLERLIEDFLTPDQYVRNAQIKEHSAERVEFAIRYPVGDDGDDMLLPIDAKFPREDYERLIEAAEGGDVKLVAHFRNQLHIRIKACARDIKLKYIDPPRTQDHGILFLPTEGLYSEVAREPDLIQYLYRECNVLVAGPMNLAGILNSFRMNFRQRELAKRSSEVWKVLSAVRTEFGRYNDVVSRLGKQLQTASNSVESLGQRTRAMDRKLRGVETLADDGSAQKLLGIGVGAVIADTEADLLMLETDEPAALDAPVRDAAE